MNRFIGLAILALGVAAPARGADRDALREQSARVFEAAGLRGVRVDNSRGLIEVRRSPDGRIHLTALKVVRAPGNDRERLARETRVETATEGGVLTVKARYPQGQALRISFWDLFHDFETPRVEVRLSLDVPDGLAVTLASASGDLRSTGIGGPQTLASTSGDIELADARGPVKVTCTSGSIDASAIAMGRLRSVSGDVVVDGVKGPLQVSTTSGEISVRGAADSLRLDSVSGDVRVDAAPRGLAAGTTSGEVSVGSAAGALEARSSSGDVSVRAAPGLARARIESVSGDIELDVPRGFGATFEMSTASGALDAALGLEVRTVTRHELRGTVGDGRVRVVLKSASGDIHVTSGGR